MISQEQFVAYVAGSILDELGTYDCSELTFRKIQAVVQILLDRAAFDHNTVGLEEYYAWFLNVLETVQQQVEIEPYEAL